MTGPNFFWNYNFFGPNTFLDLKSFWTQNALENGVWLWCWSNLFSLLLLLFLFLMLFLLFFVVVNVDVSIVVFDPRKFHQNRLSNSWVIAGIDFAVVGGVGGWWVVVVCRIIFMSNPTYVMFGWDVVEFGGLQYEIEIKACFDKNQL